jgi:hypothetical protein
VLKSTRLLIAGATAVALVVIPLQATAATAPTRATAASASTAAAAPTAKTFKNCTALNKKYPHGVGKSRNVKDRNSKGQVVANPVTNFKVSKALYLANKKSDRDGDGIACEKK